MTAPWKPGDWAIVVVFDITPEDLKKAMDAFTATGEKAMLIGEVRWIGSEAEAKERVEKIHASFEAERERMEAQVRKELKEQGAPEYLLNAQIVHKLPTVAAMPCSMLKAPS